MAMTRKATSKLPRGTNADIDDVVPSGNTPKSSTGKTIKPAGSQGISKGAKVTRAPEGQTNGIVPRTPVTANRSNRLPTQKAFGPDNRAGKNVGKGKVVGPIASGGGSFGQP